MIDLRLCTVEEAVADVRGAALIVADPPWTYDQTGLTGAACNHYALSSVATIAANLDAAHTCATPDARLAVWATWPMLAEWTEATHGWRWGGVLSGGAWWKQGTGVGHHWRGDSEPVLLYTRGSPMIERAANLSNAHASPRAAHSEKPAEWMRGWLRRWTRPGDLVLDLYAGLAPLAHACAVEGRRYIGAEADPERHAQAIEGLRASGIAADAPMVRQRGLFSQRTLFTP